MLAALAELRLRPALRQLAQLASIAQGSTASDVASTAANGDFLTTRTKRDNRMRFFVINNQPGQALDLLERSLYSKPIPGPPGCPPRYLKLPPASVCNKVLDSAAQSLEAPLLLKAAEMADALALQSVGLETRALQSLVLGLGACGLGDRALPLVDRWLAAQLDALEDDAEAHRAPLHLLTSLMDAAARIDDTDCVLQVLARMAQVGLTPTVPSMTSLLECFMRMGKVETAHGILAWMRRSGLQPSAHTYAALLTLPHGACSPAAARMVLRKALEALDAMRAEGVPPTPHLFAALITVCGRARDLEAARAAWNDMRAAGMLPDLVIYTAMIDACAKSRDAATALKLYHSMRQHGLRLDIVAYSALLAALKEDPAAGQGAAQVWSEMRELGVRPNSFALSAYLDILLGQGDMASVMQLLAQASDLAADGSDHEGGPIIPSVLYAHAMQSAARSGGTAALSQLTRHMRSRGVQHTPGTVFSLLAAQAAAKSCSAAKWLLHGASQLDGGASNSRYAGEEPWEVSDATVERCLLGLGSAEAAAEAAIAEQDANAAGGGQGGGRAVGGRLPLGEAMAVLGGLAVQGRAERALQFYRRVADSGGQLGWPALQVLMFGALNACPPQPQLVLTVLAESRQLSKSEDGGGRWWDKRTERAVVAALRKVPATAELLADAGVVADAASLEARLKDLLRR